jgi:ABC-type methionine transport system permease subunit
LSVLEHSFLSCFLLLCLHKICQLWSYFQTNLYCMIVYATTVQLQNNQNLHIHIHVCVSIYIKVPFIWYLVVLTAHYRNVFSVSGSAAFVQTLRHTTVNSVNKYIKLYALIPSDNECLRILCKVSFSNVISIITPLHQNFRWPQEP